MTGPIEIFNKNMVQKPEPVDMTDLIDQVAGIVLSAPGDPVQKQNLIAEVKKRAQTEGRSRAMQYMASAYANMSS
jgi:hypothetical protein